MNEIIFHEIDEDFWCETRYLRNILSILDQKLNGWSFVVTPNLRVLPSTKYPIIVILTGDEKGELGLNPYPTANVKAIFRIYNNYGRYDNKKIFPIPCGYNWTMHSDRTQKMKRMYPEKKMADRTVDIFYSGQNIPSRQIVVNRIKNLQATTNYNIVCNSYDGFRRGMNIDEYYQMLGNCKISIAPDGTSVDTFRYNESLGSGCVVISTPKEDLWYYKNSPVVVINSWMDLTKELIDSILNSNLDATSQQNLKFYNDCLSEEAVANYIIEKINNKPMYDNIIFCNDYHNGDLHYSKEYIKDIMKKIPAKKYCYAHIQEIGKRQTFKDLENLMSIPYVRNYHLKAESVKEENNNIFINTWIGQKNCSYIMREAYEGCCLKSYYEIYQDIYKVLNIPLENFDYYIPQIDYGKLKTESIKEFVDQHPSRKILISNGATLSGQAPNFDMNNLIVKLAADNPTFTFILTDSEHRLNLPNIFYTNDIIQMKDCDLLEISYLSTFCEVIIGRSSGPFTFAVVKENINKKFVSFGTYEREAFWYEFENRLYIPTDKSLVFKNEDDSYYDQINEFIK